jgi:hypothetical protein
VEESVVEGCIGGRPSGKIKKWLELPNEVGISIAERRRRANGDFRGIEQEIEKPRIFALPERDFVCYKKI